MPSRDPWLLTPGPLTTSATVKEAMLHDWGSRDRAFIAINRHMRQRLVELAGGAGSHVCVPLQGSGTFAVEAMLGCFVAPKGRLLILVNGAYGKRMARICDYYRRDYKVLEWAEDRPVDPAAVAKALAEDPAIGHVAVVHCETTSGILNPAGRDRGRRRQGGPAPAGRCDERLRRHRRRRPGDRLRRAGRFLEQMPGRRAGPGLRHLPGRGARRNEGSFAVPVARPLRPMAGDGEDRPMALHPADPLHRRLRPGAEGA